MKYTHMLKLLNRTRLYYANYFWSASRLHWANHNNIEWFMQ